MTGRSKKSQKPSQAESRDILGTLEPHEDGFKEQVWDQLESIDNTTGTLLLGICHTVLIINIGLTVEVEDDDGNRQPISIKKKNRYASPYVILSLQKGHVLIVL